MQGSADRARSNLLIAVWLRDIHEELITSHSTNSIRNIFEKIRCHKLRAAAYCFLSTDCTRSMFILKDKEN